MRVRFYGLTALGSAAVPNDRAAPAPAGPDLCACGLLGELPRRFLDRRDLDLLEPLRFAVPGDAGDLTAPPGPPPDRGPLAAALAERNERYGHPGAARLAESLADPETLVVITGQQCGLGCGPLFTLTKAAACTLWAEELTRRGRRAVPLFWMASEDHDFAEVARAFFPSAGPDALTLGDDPEPLRPVGGRPLGSAAESLVARVLETAPSDDYRRRIEDCRQHLDPERCFAESFSRLMVRFLGDRCPLVVDSQLPALKSASAPVVRRLIARRGPVDQALAAAAVELGRRNIRLPVRSKTAESPLFLIGAGGRRRRVVWDEDGGYRLRGGGSGTLEELFDTLNRDPEALSPGVLARPVVQDAVFGTTLMILGPGELAYMTQASVLYRELDVPAPAVALRPQVLLLGARERRWLERLEAEGLDLATVLSGSDELDRRLAERCGLDFIAAARAKLEAAVQELAEGPDRIDESLAAPWTKTGSSLRRTLELFERRVVAAAARRDEVVRGRVERLRAHCLPNGKLQEREFTSLHCLASYGESLVRQLLTIDLDPRRLQPLSMDRPREGEAATADGPRA
ncbi:MAG: bacillithiol biosynthesis cysteine-adding enzyme BshC [Acidobacteria bacterium]|nr:bacillithiol biosynthesis cysteine-adding enzyme BshC [Acidobacteriota bacterium]